MKKLLALLIVFVLLFSVACTPTKNEEPTKKDEDGKNYTKEEPSKIDKNGKYYTKEDVKNYLIEYKKLPKNFITKKVARSKGWNPRENKLSDVMKGYCIGGDKFGNREKRLPIKKGRQYYECDIDYRGGKRNAKRIVFSNDGLIFYTSDHYKTFKKLHGE